MFLFAEFSRLQARACQRIQYQSQLDERGEIFRLPKDSPGDSKPCSNPVATKTLKSPHFSVVDAWTKPSATSIPNGVSRLSTGMRSGSAPAMAGALSPAYPTKSCVSRSFERTDCCYAAGAIIPTVQV